MRITAGRTCGGILTEPRHSMRGLGRHRERIPNAVVETASGYRRTSEWLKGGADKNALSLRRKPEEKGEENARQKYGRWNGLLNSIRLRWRSWAPDKFALPSSGSCTAALLRPSASPRSLLPEENRHYTAPRGEPAQGMRPHLPCRSDSIHHRPQLR